MYLSLLHKFNDMSNIYGRNYANNMKIKTFILACVAAVALTACGDKNELKVEKGHLNDELKLTGDKTVYGLACEGCTDSVVVLLPNDGSRQKRKRKNRL